MALDDDEMVGGPGDQRDEWKGNNIRRRDNDFDGDASDGTDGDASDPSDDSSPGSDATDAESQD